jgi:hypothetical protein
MVLEGSGDSEELHSTAQSPLLAALTLLLDSVRLNQCSGAFLASAVGHMPWLCKALQHKAADLQLLQQYYRWAVYGCNVVATHSAHAAWVWTSVCLAHMRRLQFSS